jgi:DNA-binding transcriptional MerR regulator
MNETAATIKELSAELHVSEQALRQWCKRNEIKKTSIDIVKRSHNGQANDNKKSDK